jgi:NitT/TauT family transport system ATP-binding protein
VTAAAPVATDSFAVRFANVTKIYGRGPTAVRAVDDVSLALRAGEFVSIVGPSGCGKSSLLLMLAGLTSPTSGDVQVEGSTVSGPVPQIGIAFQDAELLPWRSALSNVLLQAEIRGHPIEPARRRAMDLLDQVGLAGFEERYPDELSGGMAQRVALCRALLHDPDILVMDEPFGALDALTRDQMQLDLQRLWMADRKTVVLVTHSIEEAVFLSDRVVVMTQRPGRIATEVAVTFPRPRRTDVRGTPEFGHLTAGIRDLFTQLGVVSAE